MIQSGEWVVTTQEYFYTLSNIFQCEYIMNYYKEDQYREWHSGEYRVRHQAIMLRAESCVPHNDK